MVNSVIKRFFWSILILSLVLLGQSIPASALQNIGLGRVILTPGMGIETKYNDNIFFEANKTFTDGSREGRTEDLIYVFVPSLSLSLPMRQDDDFGFLLKYIGRDENFVDTDGQDKFIHDIKGYVDLQSPGKKSRLRWGGNFLDTRDPLSADFATNLFARANRQQFGTYLKGQYTPSKLFILRLNADFSRNQFKDATFEFQDLNTTNVGGTALYQLTGLTSVGIRYNRAIENYDDTTPQNVDSNMDTVMGVLEWQITNIFNILLELGYNSIRFADAPAQDREDFVFKSEITYKPIKAGWFQLYAQREIRNSTFRDIQAFVSTQVGLVWNHQWAPKWQSRMEFDYVHANYKFPRPDMEADPNPMGTGIIKVRKDSRFIVILNIDYDIQKWLRARLGYRYRFNNSNFEAVDFSQNVGFLNLTASF